MGLLDLFQKKRQKEEICQNPIESEIKYDFSTGWLMIADYYYKLEISKTHLKMTFRWEDYGTGGRLGYCHTESTKEILPEVTESKEAFCEQVVDMILDMQPYKTITKKQITEHKEQIYQCYEEDVKKCLG